MLKKNHIYIFLGGSVVVVCHRCLSPQKLWVRTPSMARCKEAKNDKLYISKKKSTVLCYFRHVNSMIMLYYIFIRKYFCSSTLEVISIKGINPEFPRRTSRTQICYGFLCFRFSYKCMLKTIHIYIFLGGSVVVVCHRCTVNEQKSYNHMQNVLTISVWKLYLLVKETRVPRENHRPIGSHWQTFIVVCSPEWPLYSLWLYSYNFDTVWYLLSSN
jgi:hypothetical protein